MRWRNTLILFSKALQICRVKTRMWPALSHRECLYLHRHSAQHLVYSLYQKAAYNFVVYTTGDGSHNIFPAGISVKHQTGYGLGNRMYNAISNELRTSERVVLIGTDCLEMNVSYVELAFSKLFSNRNIVLGPANDGGYVLIGARKISKHLFANINWGSSNVLSSTIHNANSLGVKTHLLTHLVDVDNKEDLLELYDKNMLPSWAVPLLHTN